VKAESPIPTPSGGSRARSTSIEVGGQRVLNLYPLYAKVARAQGSKIQRVYPAVHNHPGTW